MRKPGPKTKSEIELRRHQVNCRLTSAELAVVDSRRGAISRAAWLRTAALQRPPRIIPKINREAWAYLAQVAGGLTYLVEVAKVGGRPSFDPAMLTELRKAIAELRRQLIGVSDET
ncbi:hypothetical protein [Desulfovibrio sp. Huiquan2017]|uniref:hypothetical protein n=1 Tax=Desulfovibrio sp. Huiquan2017 TaxID=2816861 RepID=UPI001A917B2A|nr:hypothetical protein [Desulfovibrio sp. Huiquan2017]